MPWLELHKNGQIDKGLILAKIREPDAADPTAACRFRGTKEGLARRAAITACVELRRTVIPARGRDAARAGPIGNASVAIIILPAKCDVLLGHIVKGDRRIPSFVRVPGIFSKVRRIRGCRDSGLSIDRGKSVSYTHLDVYKRQP